MAADGSPGHADAQPPPPGGGTEGEIWSLALVHLTWQRMGTHRVDHAEQQVKVPGHRLRTRDIKAKEIDSCSAGSSRATALRAWPRAPRRATWEITKGRE